MLFCILKGHILHCKRASFTHQKGVFYKPLCNCLIIYVLRNAFLIIIVRFRGNSLFYFVRLFRDASMMGKFLFRLGLYFASLMLNASKKGIDTVCREFLMTFILHLFLLTK